LKVLHVSTFDTGGAANAMLRWHSHLLNAGVASRVLCFQKSLDHSEVLSPAHSADRIEAIKSRATQERWIDNCRASFSDNFFSQPFFASPLLREELVHWADVLHIHWVSRSFSLSHLADLAVVGKPLVLTPHDLWTVTGGCHYPAGCEQFRDNCCACPMVTAGSQRLVEISHRFKRSLFLRSLRALVCPSTWIQNEIARCSGFEAVQSFLVPYAWDPTKFWPERKAFARSALGVPSDRIWLLFVAENVNETRKGFGHFLQLVRNAEERMRDEGNRIRCGVLITGRGESISEKDFDLPVIKLGFLGDPAQLRMAYSSADLFLYTGLEDNLPNVITDALACGTPVLGYATGGVVDQVRSEENGILVPTGNMNDATSALVELLRNPARIEELAGRARMSVELRFDNQRIVNDLVSVYEKVASAPIPKSPFPSLNREWADEYEEFAVRALADLLERSVERFGELEGEVNWLRKQSFELGSVREVLRLCFAEIDEMFSLAPRAVRDQYARIAEEITEGSTTGESLQEQWRLKSTQIYFLKEHLGWRPKK
jgi:glycosyltransferase involved in cell wall biosynthesis